MGALLIVAGAVLAAALLAVFCWWAASSGDGGDWDDADQAWAARRGGELEEMTRSGHRKPRRARTRPGLPPVRP
jgi:hypothetical protein